MRTETSTDDRRAATRRCLARFAAGLALAGLLAPATAAAAPPSNDDRTTPMALGSLPVQVSGTTADATRATTDPFSPCAPDGRQVWYRFTAASDGRVAVRVRADGALDAAVDVYLSERSQTRNLTCDVTDSHGLGAADFTVAKGSDYLIAISQLRNSVAGTFTLTVVTAQPPPRPPGRVLPAQGANGTLDRVGNIQDAYSLAMRAGRTYRIHLSGRGEGDCSVSAALYPPKISDFSGSPVKRFGCNAGGYATYTPAAGEGGRYSILVTASRGVRTLQSFHLEASGAGADDSAPGRFLANRRTAPGSLNGARIDALDLYRFSIARRSDLKLTLKAGSTSAFDLLLLNDRGRTVECSCSTTGDIKLARQLAPGRYFVAVRARDRSAGRYELRRVSRTLTRTAVAIDRRSTLGTSATISVRVRPAVSGPVTLVVQRFDPLAGWLFSSQRSIRASKGRAKLSYVAPAVGRWRVRATFIGTIGAGPSVSGFDEMLVVARRRS